MICIIRICCILFSMMAYAWSKDPLSFLQPVQHQPRFTNYEVTLNSSYGKVLEASIKQYYDVQTLNVHLLFHKGVTINRMNFELNKCKEHYIDCVNARTFDFVNVCGNEKAVRVFYTTGYKNRDVTCEFQQGDYIMKNITIKQEITAMFFSPTEKWWELSFKWRLSFYNKENNLIIRLLGDNEMITYRMRNHKPSRT